MDQEVSAAQKEGLEINVLVIIQAVIKIQMSRKQSMARLHKMYEQGLIYGSYV